MDPTVIHTPLTGGPRLNLERRIKGDIHACLKKILKAKEMFALASLHEWCLETGRQGFPDEVQYPASSYKTMVDVELNKLVGGISRKVFSLLRRRPSLKKKMSASEWEKRREHIEKQYTITLRGFFDFAHENRNKAKHAMIMSDAMPTTSKGGDRLITDTTGKLDEALNASIVRLSRLYTFSFDVIPYLKI